MNSPSQRSIGFVTSPEVAAALAAGKPVVALESTIIATAFLDHRI